MGMINDIVSNNNNNLKQGENGGVEVFKEIFMEVYWVHYLSSY